MRQLLFSTITLLIFSFVLTACSSSDTATSKSSNKSSRVTPKYSQYISPINSVGAVDLPELSTDHDSLTTASDSANTTNTAIDVTLKGLAVLGDDSTTHTRATTETAWYIDADADGEYDDGELNPDITTGKASAISRITSSAVTLTFDADGEASVKTAYLDKEYSTDDANVTLDVDRSSGFFGFDSGYMAYISWRLDENADLTATNNTLTAEASDIDGAMIVGFETLVAEFPAIAGAITFTGAGKGIYGVLDGSDVTRYDTTFVTTANVNFATRLVNVKNTETACVGSCDLSADTLALLDFTASGLSFNNSNKTASVNNVLGSVTIDSSLIGTVDGRFYGTNAREFGGTFALIDGTDGNNRYYYGAFGGERSGVFALKPENGGINTPINVNHTETISTDISINDVASADVAGSVTMKALAVYSDSRSIYRRSSGQAWDATNSSNYYYRDNYQTNIIARYSNSAANIGFYADGKVSSVDLYLGGDSYDANFNGADTNTTTLVSSANIVDKPEDADSATISVYRGSNIFGFNPEYMAQIRWSVDKAKNDASDALEQTTYAIDGMMIAGIETAAISMINRKNVAFTGEGRGYVNLSTGSRKTTIFDITADIDFTATTASLTTNDSKLCNASFGSCNTDTAYDFKTASPIYFGTTNSISGAIINAAEDEDGFSGRVDARFYGADAHEFGGAFAMSNAANEQYYGVFGGLNDIYDYEKIFDDPVTTSAADLPSETDTDSLNSFTTAFNTSDDENLTGLKTFGVEKFTERTHMRDASRIGNAWTDVEENSAPHTVRFRRSEDARFDVKIGTTIKKPTLYFAENKLHVGEFTVNNGDIDLGTDKHQYNGLFHDNGMYVARALNGSVDNVAFNGKFMIFVRWEGRRNNLGVGGSLDSNLAEDKDYDVWGYGVAGFETAYANIPKTGTAVFNGSAFAHYSEMATLDTPPAILSDIRATINFAERTAQFTSSNACKVCTGGNKNLTEYAHLNFTTQKTRYDDAYSGTAGKNQILANATTQGDDDNPAMNGMLEARFYGTGTGNEAVKELGGTFAFQGDGDHSGRTYVGHFGTKR